MRSFRPLFCHFSLKSRQQWNSAGEDGRISLTRLLRRRCLLCPSFSEISHLMPGHTSFRFPRVWTGSGMVFQTTLHFCRVIVVETFSTGYILPDFQLEMNFIYIVLVISIYKFEEDWCNRFFISGIFILGFWNIFKFKRHRIVVEIIQKFSRN